MATKLRRSLYIGLGGTGMRAILQTKKMFIENYGGEVPPMIGFLGIDTDGAVYDKKLESKYGEVSLMKSEQLSISCKDPKSFFNARRKNLSWLPDENSYAIMSLDKGAGQIRTNGRLAIIINIENIQTALKNALDKIRSKDIIDSKVYELMNSSKDDIHLVFSLCGGTGCGTFIDIAYLIRKIGQTDINLTGYGVLPDVFKSMVRAGTAMDKVKSNAYGAIKDLDFLMHLTPTSKDITFDFIQERFLTNDPPFNAVMLIDNKNEKGITYQHVDELSDMISLALFTASGQISQETASVGDNVEKTMKEGNLDVKNKRAWVSGLGACQIIFKGEDVAEVYAIKAAQRAIQRLVNNCADTNNIANQWIDSPEVNIRENNGNDNTINALFSKEPKYQFSSISRIRDAKEEAEEYIRSVLPNDAERNESLQKLEKRVLGELKKLMVSTINMGDCGVGAIESLSLELLKQVDIFIQEMTTEIQELNDNEPQLIQQMKIAIEDLQAYDQKFFKIKAQKAAKEEDVLESARNLACNKIEIIRRIDANKFFNSLKRAISEEYEKGQNIKRTLINVNDILTTELTNTQNLVGQAPITVEINLAEEMMKSISIDDNNIILKEFTDSLPNQNIYEIGDTQQAKEFLKKFTHKLPRVKELLEMGIDDMIESLTEEEYQKIIKKATDKAMPLLKINSEGKLTNNKKMLEQAINKYYYVAVPDKNNSRLTQNNSFINYQESVSDINFISSGMKDRIIIYRQEGTVPAFAIAALKTYKSDYDNGRCFFHFDANIYKRMENENYSLYPEDTSNEALEFWVKGLIFGFIKFETKKYWYKDWKSGKAIKDYWINTDENQRDQAYEKFKRNIGSLKKQYQDKFNEIEENAGTEKMKEMFADVKSNYFNKYAQCEANIDTIQKAGYERVEELVELEMVYVEKDLYN